MEQTFSIVITGSGTSAQLAEALREVADQIKNNDHVTQADKVGDWENEDYVLHTIIALKD